ncbi:Xenotropic and polytropic retrovirus receptor 1 [Ophidiomyces ophidiicola]|nr:Xenotropic and polytropic retrovirus receptor 1 [Ophidiomyces ophidiicola]KAI1915241.1 Xenotropic and polytropic retrovirus receptor 1 [Ophidiomyces ophidiicola]KAI1928888.1 Xenotropic and polytropic retrovirus receptor 1 [Ophidiomyces ophidiicola]KAI1953423.1 Xenotropic and polytropic retrovirus receptor 1 [Ophidiomyces ophidiicola]KAI1982733.1 Xenotropic and polytropic retrovirus receptor 1 [Ophidiomyces ophidiicola]
MKFAKDLEQELVPEWRAKYLNYKQGKKKIKAITRALRAIDQAPRTPSRRAFGLSGSDGTPQSTRPPFRHLGSFRRMRSKAPSRSRREPETLDGERSPTDVRPQETSFPETQPLRTPGSRFADHTGGYGSIISAHSRSATLPSLELPDPALDPNDTNFPPHSQMFQSHSPQSSAQSKPPRAQNRRSLPHSILPGPRNPFRSRSDSVPAPRPVRKNSFLQRMFVSRLPHDSPATKPPAEAFIEVRHREHEFFSFLDKELAKIEAFYRMKEEESTERLKLLKEQLHVMRDSRIEQLRSKARSRIQGERLPNSNTMSTLENGPSAAKWKGALKKTDPSSDLNKLSKELEELPTPGSTLHRSHDTEEYRDFVRKKEHDVPYRSAKRKLKVAILEYYRGLELLKAYAYLNRKAFRKINKKYDKATNARPTGRYIAEKVNKAWFVQSDLVENHLVAVEDLYTRYFERGNRKVAVTKLRGKATRSQDYSSNSFRNGLLFAAGLVLGIQGLVYAVQHLFNHGNNSSGALRVQTGYLLQV